MKQPKITVRYIAQTAEVPERTLYRWRGEHPMVYEALRQFAQRRKAAEKGDNNNDTQ